MNRWLLLSLIVLITSCGTTKKVTTKSKKIGEFTIGQFNLISSGESYVPMRVWKTDNLQDSILLRQKSSDFHNITRDTMVAYFAKRLLATVKDSASIGVGIAAPQVGILKNMIWVQRFDKEAFPFECFLNPRIKIYSEEKQPAPEGCLSIPNKQGLTKIRAKEIAIEYDKLDGTHHMEKVDGFTSVIFQHEIDHLHGILFIDHIESE